MKKGFTLLEVMVAVVILAGAILVLGNSWSGSQNALRKARNATKISLLLQKKMTELELKYKDKPLAEIPEDDNGDFGSDYKEYRWELKSKKLEIPDLTSALTAREGGASEMELTIVRQLTDLLETSVKEMRVSVIWKKNAKDYVYSLTTYMIDYTQSLAAPPATTPPPTTPGNQPPPKSGP